MTKWTDTVIFKKFSKSKGNNFSNNNLAAPIFDWLIDYLRFYVPLKNISLIWRRHHCRWRAAKFRPLLGAQGLWAGRDLYRATPAVTRDLRFSGLIRRTAPFSRLLRHTRGCGGSILARILTGTHIRTLPFGLYLQFFMIHLYTKYHLNPANHQWENERKLSLSWVWRTDGWTDGEPDGHHHTIIRPVFNGRIKMSCQLSKLHHIRFLYLS
jgi:hypothetical protein